MRISTSYLHTLYSFYHGRPTIQRVSGVKLGTWKKHELQRFLSNSARAAVSGGTWSSAVSGLQINPGRISYYGSRFLLSRYAHVWRPYDSVGIDASYMVGS